MKRNSLYIILLIIMVLCAASCSKEPSYINDYLTTLFANDEGANSPSQGDDKKVDIKGSLMNGDMKHPNIEAWLSEKTLFVRFNETVENCMVVVFTEGGRVVYSRQVEEQQPGIVRIYLGNKPLGDYRLYITNGTKEADGWVSLN